MKKLVYLVIIVEVLLFPVRVWAQEDVSVDLTTVEEVPATLYVRTGCSHCEKVEEFLLTNNLSDAVTIRDVSVDDGANIEYTQFMRDNNVPEVDQGVPFLVYDDGQWLSGDQPIIDWLAEKYGITVEEPIRALDTSDYLILGVGAVVVAVIVGYGIMNVINGKKRR